MFSSQSRWKLIAGTTAAAALAIVLVAAAPQSGKHPAMPPAPNAGHAQPAPGKPASTGSMTNPSRSGVDLPAAAGRFYSPAFGTPYAMPNYGGYGGPGYGSMMPGYPYAMPMHGYGGAGYGGAAGTPVTGTGEEKGGAD